ncbi:MAG: transposase [Crocinitomicaceae bacterium]|nr:transposase [Crocinitomicaceae bacterium]
MCRQQGISQPTFFSWKKKYSGMDAINLKRLKELEVENSRLKRMFTDVSLQRDIILPYIQPNRLLS